MDLPEILSRLEKLEDAFLTGLQEVRSIMTLKGKEVKVMKGTMFRLDADAHKALRIAAIEEGISMNEALTHAVELWLRDHRKRLREGVKK